MKIIKRLAVLSCLLLIQISCQKERIEDKNKPTISNVLINDQTSMVTVDAGDTIKISALLQDDQELGVLYVKVKGSESTSNWSEAERIDLSGEAYKLSKDLIISHNANPGYYILRFEFTDHLGNKTSYEETFLVANNYFQPQIHNLNVAFDGGNYDYQNGDTLKFTGTLTDDQDLSSIGILLKIPPGYTGNQTFFSDLYMLNGQNDTFWDFKKDGKLKVYFPPYSKTGDYTLTITVIDNENNTIKITQKVSVNP